VCTNVDILDWRKWAALHEVEYLSVVRGYERPPWSLLDWSLVDKLPTSVMDRVAHQALSGSLPPGPSEEDINHFYTLQVSSYLLHQD
jgi:hypothetical protein